MGLLSPLAALAVIAWIWRDRRPGTGIVLLWLLSAVGGIWAQGKFFSYHWWPTLPPLVILAAEGTRLLWRELGVCKNITSKNQGKHKALPLQILELVYLQTLKGRWSPAELDGFQDARKGQRALPLIVVLLIVFAYLPGSLAVQQGRLGRDLPYLLGQTSRSQYLANFGHNILGRDVYSFAATEETARYLQAHSRPDEPVLVWGFQALVNFLAERPSPTRYIFNYPLSFDQPGSDFRLQARRTFLADLARRPPTYIVLVTNDVNPIQPVDSYTLFQGFPEFRSLVQERYRLEKDIADFHLYRRLE